MIKYEASAELPTQHAVFTVKIYRNKMNQEVTAICSGKIEGKKNLAVRVHSACFTAETLGSLKCDCKQQLDQALKYIAANEGIVIYLPQEGRGIGLSNKIRAYALQEKGYDTIKSNEMLGLPVDARTYEDASDILTHLNVDSIRLLTNNPHKIENLIDLGVKVTGRVPIACETNKHSVAYLDTKQKQMGHLINVDKIQKRRLKISRNVVTKRPFVHVNFAMDSLSQTASDAGEPVSISCHKDWQRVHELREKYCAIAVGANTWDTDSPRLTVRLSVLGRKPSKQPVRIIFTGSHNCQVSDEINSRKTIIIGENCKTSANNQIHITSVNHLLSKPLSKLYELNIKSILVEGGMELIASFVKQEMIDLLTIYVKTHCPTTAINAAVKLMPELAADQIEAQTYGEGTLLSVSFNQGLVNHPEYGVVR